jgi:hypothetical protein
LPSPSDLPRPPRLLHSVAGEPLPLPSLFNLSLPFCVAPASSATVRRRVFSSPAIFRWSLGSVVTVVRFVVDVRFN